MTKSPENLEKYQKHFSEDTFLGKVTRIAKKAGKKVVYLALLLYYELTDPSVPVKSKGIIIGALGYLVLPIDLIPDFIPIAGFADDFSALVAAYTTIRGNITPEIRANAQKKLEEWFGEVDTKSLEDEINDSIDEQ